jgi:hypothetical protein
MRKKTTWCLLIGSGCFGKKRGSDYHESNRPKVSTAAYLGSPCVHVYIGPMANKITNLESKVLWFELTKIS